MTIEATYNELKAVEISEEQWNAFIQLGQAIEYLKLQRGIGGVNFKDAVARNQAIGILNRARYDALHV